jgi:aminoglycoside 3-N-acetyltransferase
LLSSALSRIPILEVGVRLAYWRVPVLHAAGNRVRQWSDGRRKRQPAEAPRPVDFDKVLAALRQFGVAQGDILIVHSSFAALKPAGRSPEQVIEGLKGLVGDQGTLAMPAIPIIRGEPAGSAKFDPAAYERVFEYDARSSRIQTGALPKTMLSMPGAHRSRHPGNSMVAIGPQAEAMMADNLAAPEPTPCGPGSAWEFAYRHNAKVVALGIDLVHSLTMIHVAEDAFEAQWPVPDWYLRRRFKVRDGDFEAEVVVRERRHGWSQFYAERAFSADLQRAAISKSATVDGLDLHYCESAALVDFLRHHPRRGYPYVFPLGYMSSGSKAK